MWIIDYPKTYFWDKEAILTGDVHFEKCQIETYHLLKLNKEANYYFKTINVE